MNIWIVLYKAPPTYYTSGGDLTGSSNYGYVLSSMAGLQGATSGTTQTPVKMATEPEIIGAFHKEELAEKFIVQRISDCRFSLGTELANVIEPLNKDPNNNKFIVALYNRYSGGNLSAKKVKLQGHPLE